MKHNKKFLSLLLTVCMAVSLIPATVMADTGKAQVKQNAIVGNMLLMDDPAPAQTTSEFTDLDEAGSYLTDKLVARDTEITLTYHFSSEENTFAMSGEELQTYANDLSAVIMNKAYKHTGNPAQGDYLRWHVDGYSVTMSYSPFSVDYTYTMRYYASAEQEAQVTSTIKSVLESLNLDDKSDYEKFIAIYNYVTKNTTYDNANLNDETYRLKYSAYAALINHTAVCQGYANLLYRMLLQAGIDNRIIAGIGNGGPHAWNIVKLGELYYNVDSTWDSKDAPVSYHGEKFEYHYLMKNRLRGESSTDFPNHSRYTEYTTDEFVTQYPMSSVRYACPSFLGHAVSLYDEISVRFLVDIPEGVDTSTVYVDFALADGRRAKVYYDDSKESTYTETSRWFDCKINAMEIADTITATLHYGTVGDTLENSYSLQQYCKDISTRGGYSQSAINIVCALQDYGYYLQNSGWTDGNTHMPADKLTEYTSDDITRVLSNVETYAFVSPVGKHNIIQAGYSVTMNSKTKIKLYVRLAEGHFYPDNSNFKPVEMNGEDRWYVYEFKDIGPMSIGTIYTLNGAEVSVLSYVNSVLKNTSGSFTPEKQNAMIALYDYYEAVLNFVSTPDPQQNQG